MSRELLFGTKNLIFEFVRQPFVCVIAISPFESESDAVVLQVEIH